jgi:hypothetical protein
MVYTMHKAVQKLKSLPAGQKEAFANSFVKGATKLVKQQDTLITSRLAIPSTLPDALVKPTVPWARNKKRRLTGRELAEREERDRIRNNKRATREAEVARREGDEIAQQMRKEAVDARAQFHTRLAEVRAQKEAKRQALPGKSVATAFEIDSDLTTASDDKTSSATGNEVAIKIELGLEDKEVDRDQYRESSVISELTQFQTQEFNNSFNDDIIQVPSTTSSSSSAPKLRKH